MGATCSIQETCSVDDAVRFIDGIDVVKHAVPADIGAGIGYLPAERDPNFRKPMLPRGPRGSTPSKADVPIKKVINVLSAIAMGKGMRSFLMDPHRAGRAVHGLRHG